MALNVVAVEDDVAQMNADAVAEPLLPVPLGLPRGDLRLHRECAAYGFDHAGKGEQGAVAHKLDHPAVIGRDDGANQVAPIVSRSRRTVSSSLRSIRWL